jgi:hypothetical protein
MHWLLFLYLLPRLLHVSALMCHLQEASFIFASYFKVVDKVTHGTTTSGAHRPPTFTVQGYIPMT